MENKVMVLIILLNIIAVTLQKPEEFTSVVLNNNKKNPNWFKFGEKIYYVDTVFKANWYKAMQFCRQQGMHLLSISNKVENDRIGKFVTDNNIKNGHFWTSGNNQAGNLDWIWLSTGQNIVYTNWYAGEPNQRFNSTENCLEARHWGSSGFTWNDLNCQAELYFICESITDCADASNLRKRK